MSAVEVRQLALFADEPAEEPKPARREPVPPPEGFRPDLRRGLAWCPYCGEAREFAWDAETCYARCPECGVSAEDFYTKTHNGLWPEEPMKKFAEAVKGSGRAVPGAAPAGERAAPRGEPRPAAEGETTAAEPPWEEIWCPECGRFIRAAYRPARVRCRHCGSMVVLSGDGGLDWEPPRDAARCRRCGRLLEEDPKPGAAYFCWRCSFWSAAPGDRRGEREAEAANAALPDRKARRGPLPGPVLSRARDLAGECANYQASGPFGIRHYCVHEPAPEGSCVFFAKERKDRRCRWFEEALLPLEPHLAKAYWKSYEEKMQAEGEGGKEADAGEAGGEEPAAEGGAAAAAEAAEAAPEDAGREAKRAARKAAREARKVLEQARKKREKVCAKCGKTFIPQRGKEKSKYCSEECRREVEKKQTREWRERKAGKTSL